MFSALRQQARFLIKSCVVGKNQVPLWKHNTLESPGVSRRVTSFNNTAWLFGLKKRTHN